MHLAYGLARSGRGFRDLAGEEQEPATLREVGRRSELRGTCLRSSHVHSHVCMLTPREEHARVCTCACQGTYAFACACSCMSVNIWSLHMSKDAVLQNPRDIHLPCSLSEWLCSVQPQGAPSHFEYDVTSSPEHKHTCACL